MAISRDGDFQDEAQFREFGKLIRKTYSNPIRLIDRPALADGCCEIRFDAPQPVRYLMLREDIRDGQRIRGFRILADGKQVYESACVGHKRIVPFDNLTAKTIAVERKALRSPFEGAALFDLFHQTESVTVGITRTVRLRQRCNESSFRPARRFAHC